MKEEDTNEMDLQANRVPLQGGNLWILLEILLNNDEKNDYIFLLLLAQLTTNIINEIVEEFTRGRPPGRRMSHNEIIKLLRG